MNRATTVALESGHTSIREERNGRIFQIDISRIESAGKVMGLVILAFDISEREYAERARREFSANVSHELKTPLTSIIASADLIENNLVKPEDMSRFIGHIKKEAIRLLTLIEDIIRLSQLDEGVELPTEAVDLSTVAKEAVEQLQDTADNSNVQIDLRTESCILQGVPGLLHEIVYNLVENAIKYNIPGGTVAVSVGKTANGVELKVSDIGIGIPAEHQDRVFERFYRVDKSHSKQSGGTGLGLSIVKHAASYFDAVIDLQSEVGKGTTITVTFPV
jgi:two-component system phosphate regulon sensor histidine kinase PhoR